MLKRLKILLKKELYEFRFNYKAWFLGFLSVLAVYVPTSWKKEAPVFLAIVIFELYLLFVFQDFSNADLLWFIPTIIFNTGLIYNVSILAKRSDLLTSSIVMSVSFFVIETLFLLSNFFIRFLILIILSLITLTFASKLSKTINYRAEISTNR